MNITKQSQLTGKTRTMNLPITQEQLDRWKGGELIQNVFPNLSKSEREFMITGITQDEWDILFPNEDEEYEGLNGNNNSFKW